VDIDRTFRRITLVLGAVCATVAGGMAMARWTIDDTNGFYTDPYLRAQRPPAYARAQPVADTFWEQQEASVREGPR
jgi:hypothetical protein